MPSTKSHISFLFTLLAIVWGVLIAANTLRAQWSSPTAIPPGNNPASFLTTGINPESKSGVLTLTNNFYVIGIGLVGKVGIGTSTIESSSRLVVEPYTNASIDAGAGSIRTSWQAAHNDDVINKSYLTSTLNASIDSIKYWTLSGNNLYASSTAYNIAIGTTTAGTAKLAVMGGNVGVGTTGPGYLLDVAGAASSNAFRVKGLYTDFQSSGGENRVRIQHGNDGNNGRVTIYNNAAVSMIDFNTGGDSYFNAGKVGIGTTNPFSGKLHVNKSATGALGGDIWITNNASSYGGNSARLAFEPNSTTDPIPAASIIYTHQNPADSYKGFFSIKTYNGSSEVEQIRIDGTSGNVGIGTTTPTVSLQVNGYAIANTPTHVSHLATKGYVDTAAQSLWVNSGSYLYASSTSWRVGIGTTSPASALHIYPQNNIEGLRVVSSNYSPLVISTAAGVDLFRVNQSGDVTAVTSSATRMRSNNYCDASGNNCFNPTSGWSTEITTIFLTSTTINGNFVFTGGFVGYDAGNKICNSQQAGSHFCRTDEIMYLIQKNGASSFSSINGQDAWIADGPPGFTGAVAADDCSGWTNGTTSYLGHFWIFNSSGGGKGALINCATTKKIACCK